MKSITIKDIARMANVSYATVSRALNGHKDVKEETRKRIFEICEKIGYTQNAIARGLVTKSTNTIGLILPDITNPYFPEIAWGVEDEASKMGYNTILCNTNWDLMKEESYLKILLGKRVEGIIIAPVSEETVKLVNKYYGLFPVVFLGGEGEGTTYDCVVVDNEKGSFMAAEYLIKLGHRKIAFIGGKEGSNTFVKRLEGYKTALRKYGISIDPNLIRSSKGTKESGYKKENGYKIALELLTDAENRPTAIMAINDLIALGVIEAAEELGMSIPEDVSVVGFDDIPYASLPKIKLTTVSQPINEIGRAAAQIIFERIMKKSTKNEKKMIMEPKLIERSTCKPL